MTPRVSIAILSHRPALLPQAVASALRQTHPAQVLVQHDAENFPGKLNAIMAAARGDWLIPLCDDDQLAPTYVERCLYFSGDADVVFTDRRVWWEGWDWFNPRAWLHRAPAFGFTHRMFGSDLAQLALRDGYAARVTLEPKHFAFGSPLPMTCMIRRTLWQDMGGYDDIPHADTELWYRMVKAGARIVYVPEPLFLYRYHEGQISRADPSNGNAALAFHRKHFMDFGFAFTPRSDMSTLHDCEIIPPDQRAEYVRRHGMQVA